MEKISFAAAYGNERVLGYLQIPKHATPPYQTILYADQGMSTRLPSPQPAQEHFCDFLVKSGGRSCFQYSRANISAGMPTRPPAEQGLATG